MRKLKWAVTTCCCVMPDGDPDYTIEVRNRFKSRAQAESFWDKCKKQYRLWASSVMCVSIPTGIKIVKEYADDPQLLESLMAALNARKEKVS